MDGYPFIEEFNGQEFLETEEGSYVALVGIFEMYSDPDMTMSEVAETHGISEDDVSNAIFYWTEEEEVYERLVEKSGEYEQDYLPVESGVIDSSEDLGAEFDSFNPIHAAGDAFQSLGKDPETRISEQNIVDDPNKTYFEEGTAETHIEWKRNGSQLGVYAGWDDKEGFETGLVSFSVGNEEGPVLQVDIEEMKPMVYEMYINAVFGSLN